jgi:hypothetical protein
MPQLSFSQDPAVGYPGMLADSGFKDIISGISSLQQVVSIAVTSDDDAVYTVTINGTDFEYTADSSTSTAEITVGLADLINAGSEPVTASGTDTPLVLTADQAGVVFTVATSATGTGDLVATTTVTPDQQIPFGHAVVFDTGGTQQKSVRLPSAAGDVTDDDGYQLAIAVEDRAREGVDLGSGVAGYRANTVVACLNKGRVLVKVEANVVKNARAYVRYAAGGNGLGAFGASGSGFGLVERFIYRTTTSAGGLAVVEAV